MCIAAEWLRFALTQGVISTCMLDLCETDGLILFKLFGIGREDLAFWHSRREAVKRVHTLGERMRKMSGEIRRVLQRIDFLLRERVEEKKVAGVVIFSGGGAQGSKNMGRGREE
jgi:hypothetical protein